MKILTDYLLSPSPDKKKSCDQNSPFLLPYAFFPIFCQDLEKSWWKYNIYLDLMESGVLFKKQMKKISLCSSGTKNYDLHCLLQVWNWPALLSKLPNQTGAKFTLKIWDPSIAVDKKGWSHNSIKDNGTSATNFPKIEFKLSAQQHYFLQTPWAFFDWHAQICCSVFPLFSYICNVPE